MKRQSYFGNVLATLKRVSAILPLPTFDVGQQQAWRQRNVEGQPAITVEDFPIKEAALLLVELVASLEEKHLDSRQAVKMAQEYATEQGQSGYWQSYAITPERGMMYVHLACQSALAQKAKLVLETVAIAEWGANYCPVCGGTPLFGVRKGAVGQRMLVCGACLTNWRYKRIGCNFCGEENPEQLKVVETDEFPGWSATVCRSCSGFLKTADLRQLTEEPCWQKAVLELLPLDYAVEKWLTPDATIPKN